MIAGTQLNDAPVRARRAQLTKLQRGKKPGMDQ